MAWFPTDADCLDYLEWLRWPDGFVCPGCEHAGGWRMGDGRFRRAGCDGRTSVTAGTIFDRTRTPLTVWFNACWLLATQKDGISALSLQRSLEMGSYQTAWAMLHRLRSVLVRPGRQKGKKSLVGVAVERHEPKGFGRCRMAILPDASAVSLRAFLVVTDGWASYPPATAGLYTHQPHVVPGPQAGKLLPGVHRVASLAKRWLLGTHQGSVDEAHLPGYLDEFVFRFNRRPSRSRGLLFYRVLELAVAHEPVRYRDLIVNPEPKKNPPLAPGGRGHPPSLERPPANRPWRAA